MAGKTVTGNEIVADARRYLGVPYVYGGTNPKTGMDCSGLVYVVCHDLGITSVPRTSEEQWNWVNRVKTPAIGDLVFFVGAETDPPPGHVGIVTGPNQMIEEPHTGSHCLISNFQTNGTGVNKLIGYGSIPGAVGSPNGLTMTTAGSGSGGSSPSINPVTAAGGFIGTAIAFVLLLGLAVLFIGGGFYVWKINA